MLLCRRARPLVLFLAAFWCLFTAPAYAAWGFDQVAALARARAAVPYVAPDVSLPPALSALDYDGLRDIRFRPARALWRDGGAAFEAMFFHRGRFAPEPVRIHEVGADGNVRPVPWRAPDYDYGKNRLPTQAWPDLGHAGFRVHYPLNGSAYKDELVVFLGASYFRALGAGQQYGLSARALAVDTVGGSGPEEFPRFTDFWLERPAADGKQLIVHALLDSPRLAGAWTFVITPGQTTRMEVRARVFLRATGKTITTLGVAPLTSMFLAGENQPRPGDFRPEVHDSDGLMVASSSGEWLWRPLQNPSRVLTTSFALPGLRGFGLMQRDRAFTSYEDTEAHYERRPSAWVRPLGDWGPGRVELVQLSTPDESHDNVVAYWVPERLPAAGEPFDYAYELSWQGDEQQRPPASWVVQSRRGLGFVRPQDVAATAGLVQYVLDFNGPALAALAPDAPVQPVVTADANGHLEQQLAWFNPGTRGWRVVLRVRPVDPAAPVELRAFLQHGNDIVSETWTHIVLPDPSH
ncbi:MULTISPECIES: glucan biosynthesis protein [Ramlibacter]|uniref:Glucans biosynthesis protein G n=1 Tax=Ramlibacter pinisoli TaxID=2682844 RepID=A0A6N8ITK4_9BURK|nr:MULTISPECIES: glucan biosynthesis protein G [Ramlibacter]MBA2965277.1 glucan biosynthesis protein G [Ramlibacter sp. CGMCC 1.13660]MVQ30241.1 glucan biosynthesis protein D [Ramlibacter pinisoli]